MREERVSYVTLLCILNRAIVLYWFDNSHLTKYMYVAECKSGLMYTTPTSYVAIPKCMIVR